MAAPDVIRCRGGGRPVHRLDTPEYPGFALSINGSYHVGEAPRGRRSLVPFVTGGYSIGVFSGDFPESGFNVGAGANYWSRGRSGLRLEVRATAMRFESLRDRFEPYSWLVAFRAGVNWATD
ncbi:MAG: hypothetical protein HY655_15000 [Acidobacteria bacterium]|nr:hypothetical protein [Acidobacteriota bacterium]